jgi:hypothetical protein
MDKIGVANWRAATAELADKAQDNHGISAQKFHLLREFLALGYRVLLSGARCARLRIPDAPTRTRAFGARAGLTNTAPAPSRQTSIL